MNFKRTTQGFLLMALLAFVGFVLVYVPPKIVAQYEVVSKMGTVWVYVYFSVVGLGAILFLGATTTTIWKLWAAGRRKRKRQIQRDKDPSELSADEQQAEIKENLSTVDNLTRDETVGTQVRGEIEPMVQKLEDKQNSQKLEIVAFGTISSGKSSLLNTLAGRDIFQSDPKGGTTTRRNEVPWPGMDKVVLVDTPGLGEISGEHHASVSAEAAGDADIVLLVVDGPLRDTEHQLLTQLGKMEKRILLCLNKRDWFDTSDQNSLLSQLTGQVRGVIDGDNIVAVRSNSTQRVRMRVAADGEQVEETVNEPPNISFLAQRMLGIIERDGRDLILANLLLQSRGLVETTRVRVRESIDEAAWAIVDRHMWGAGGAAALSPLPVLDLLAGSAITTKMVMELARVYRQEMDIETAVNLLGQLGKNLIAILGVSAATPVIASAIASALKTVPGAGTIAGGMLQGTVQAIVTRWIGAVFIEYFKNEMHRPEGGLVGLARRQWTKVTSAEQLKKIVAAAQTHLFEESEEDDS